MEKKKKTAAQIRATQKWDAAHYDRVLVMLPIGTKDKIRATGETVNGFIVKSVLSALDKYDSQNE